MQRAAVPRCSLQIISGLCWPEEIQTSVIAAHAGYAAHSDDHRGLPDRHPVSPRTCRHCTQSVGQWQLDVFLVSLATCIVCIRYITLDNNHVLHALACHFVLTV